MNIGNASNAMPVPQRPLDRIGHSADRVYDIAVRLGEFLDRYHGVQQTAATGDNSKLGGLLVSYSSNLDRLAANIETLEARAAALIEIG